MVMTAALVRNGVHAMTVKMKMRDAVGMAMPMKMRAVAP